MARPPGFFASVPLEPMTTVSPTAIQLQIASRMDGLRGEGAFEVLASARALERKGRHILHLEIGEPDFPTAPHIVEAGVRALQNGETKYGPAGGILELRVAIANHLRLTASAPRPMTSSSRRARSRSCSTARSPCSRTAMKHSSPTPRIRSTTPRSGSRARTRSPIGSTAPTASFPMSMPSPA